MILILLKKYLFPKQAGILALGLWISIIGVALGIVQLMTVLAVMSGFQEIFRSHYTQITSDFIVLPSPNPNTSEPLFREKITSFDGVAGVTPTLLGQGILIHGTSVAGILVEGVEPSTSTSVTPWGKIWLNEPLFSIHEETTHWIWLGSQLAQKLNAKPGDQVNLLIALGGSQKLIPFQVSAITKFGIYDHDLRYARIDYEIVKNLFHKKQTLPIYKCKVKDPNHLERIVENLETLLGDTADLRLWSDINRNIFYAVEHQKGMLFLVLEIIVALAAVNVINLLLMNSHTRKRDFAIAKAMGMQFSSVFSFFVLQGALVGFIGIIFGVTLGFFFCFLLKIFQPQILSESIYNISYLPIRIEILDLFYITGIGFLLCILFSSLPALQAARMKPVDTFRDL